MSHPSKNNLRPALWLGAAAVGAALLIHRILPSPLGNPEQTRELVVVMRNSPTTWYEDADGQPAGLEYDLVTQFARELGLRVRIVKAGEPGEALRLLASGKAHFAAAGLAVTPARQRDFVFSVPYQSVRQQLVCGRLLVRRHGVADAVGRRVDVVAGSAQAEALRRIKRDAPDLIWREVPGRSAEELLQQVDDNDLDCTVAASDIVAIEKNFLPDLEVAADLGAPLPLAWAFPAGADAWLYNQSQAFFARVAADGTLRRLIDRYYGHVSRLERADVLSLLTRMDAALPGLRALFHSAQDGTGLDWRLLAALGYQESHWDPLATSPTGVRGLMMLTEETADEMKVDDRLNPAQSIAAGANYLEGLMERLPGTVQGPDRLWMALAAYNVGLGHLEDARLLAQRLKLNPNAWTDIKKTLPLLSRASVAARLQHGVARGGETVVFVENIRTYYDILARDQPAHNSLGAGLRPAP